MISFHHSPFLFHYLFSTGFLFPVPWIPPAEAVCVGDEDGQDAEYGKEEAVPHVRHDIEGRDLHAALRGKGSRGESCAP